MDVMLKRLDQPDEVRTFEKSKFEIVRIGGMTIGRATYEPGWRWSVHLGPATGSSRCARETSSTSHPDTTAGWSATSLTSPCIFSARTITPTIPKRRSTDERSSKRAHRARDQRARCRAVHEGYASVPAMRFFQRRGPGAEPFGGQIQGRRRARRPGAAPRDQSVLRLADSPAALCQRRICRRLRHRSRDVRDRRTRGIADGPWREQGCRLGLIGRKPLVGSKPGGRDTLYSLNTEPLCAI